MIAARLAERMGVSAATVSEMVNRLTREGLLTVDETTPPAGADGRRPRNRRAHLPSPRAGPVAADRGGGLGWAEADEERITCSTPCPSGSPTGSTTCWATAHLPHGNPDPA